MRGRLGRCPFPETQRASAAGHQLLWVSSAFSLVLGACAAVTVRLMPHLGRAPDPVRPSPGPSQAFSQGCSPRALPVTSHPAHPTALVFGSMATAVAAVTHDMPLARACTRGAGRGQRLTGTGKAFCAWPPRWPRLLTVSEPYEGSGCSFLLVCLGLGPRGGLEG